jgi:hypothetical protein
MTLAFRTDPFQWPVTIAVGAVAALVGLCLIARPSALLVSASNVVAVGWAALYATLTVQQSGELVAWTTDVAILGIGLAAGLMAYRARAGFREIS